MNFFRKTINSNNPGLFIFCGVLIALNLKFSGSSTLSLILLLLVFIVCYRGLLAPWGLLLCAIPALFGLEPAPQALGRGELILALLLFLYVIGTYSKEFLTKGGLFHRGFVIAHAVLALILAASCLQSIMHGIVLKDWLRAVTPFLMLYLIIPIYITVQDDFEYKTTWIFIAFSVLAIELSSYINFIFFSEHYYNTYWLKAAGGEKIYSNNVLDAAHLLGPFRERITLALHEATSELLPVSLVGCAAVAVFSRNKFMKRLFIPAMLLSLFAILETYTRSMLLCAVIVLLLFGLLALVLGKKSFKEYIKVMLIIIVAGGIFIQATGMGDVWVGRLHTLFQYHATHKSTEKDAIASKSSGSTFDKTELTPDEKELTPDEKELTPDEKELTPDENVLVRLREYTIAFDIYKKHLVFGAGLGVKHQISFQTTEGHYLHHNVGYVHSWAMYWLMVGGIFGLLTYMIFLLGPLILLRKINSQYGLFIIVTSSSLLTMAIYASFFAVFRLISFNLIVAACCGITWYLLKYDKSVRVTS